MCICCKLEQNIVKFVYIDYERAFKNLVHECESRMAVLVARKFGLSQNLKL